MTIVSRAALIAASLVLGLTLSLATVTPSQAQPFSSDTISEGYSGCCGGGSYGHGGPRW